MLAVGVAAVVAGYIVMFTVESARTLCHDFAEDYVLGAVGAAGKIGAPSCTTDDLRYFGGIAGIVLGLVLGGSSVVVLRARSIAATAAGTPWASRRAATSVAGWLDSKLPGRNGGTRHTRPGFVTSLVVAVVLGAIVAGAASWRSYRNAQDLHNYINAGAALATTRLPADLQRESVSMCGNSSPLCARSRLSPPQLQAQLGHFFHGTPQPDGFPDRRCARNAKRGGLACSINVFGEFDGYPTIATALWHPVFVRNGHPPAGALPGGRRDLYFLGSDVFAGPVLPPRYGS